MTKFKLHVQVEIKDKNGKVIKTLKKPCKSYVRQMIELLRVQMAQTTTDTMKDTDGVTRTIPKHAINFAAQAGVGIDRYAIQVGTGTNAVTISDFKLAARKGHSATAPIFLYGATSVGVVAVVGSTASFTVARTFTNQTGASIDFKEVGLVGIASAFEYNILLERSLLNFTIANGESGTVTYTISVTV